MADQTLSTLHSFLKRDETQTSSGGKVVSYSHDTGSGAVLCMVHGYPQSAFMWRHVAPMLEDKISMFIPEQPGYGFSSLPPSSDKRVVGGLVMEALQHVFGKDRAVIWCGHDRGGRLGHRLLVDNDPSYKIKAAILLDIVPTLEQYASFANPKASVAYYHWPFLATDIAPAMLEAMGGGFFCSINLKKIKGANEAGVKRFQENHAWDLYAHQFNQPECIAGSCADYKWGATGEVEAQEADQKEGRKIKVPTLILYSASNLGRMHDVPSVWEKWVEGELKTHGVQDGYGHFLPEECPEIIAKDLIEWIDRVGK